MRLIEFVSKRTAVSTGCLYRSSTQAPNLRLDQHDLLNQPSIMQPSSRRFKTPLSPVMLCWRAGLRRSLVDVLKARGYANTFVYRLPTLHEVHVLRNGSICPQYFRNPNVGVQCLGQGTISWSWWSVKHPVHPRPASALLSNDGFPLHGLRQIRQPDCHFEKLTVLELTGPRFPGPLAAGRNVEGCIRLATPSQLPR